MSGRASATLKDGCQRRGLSCATTPRGRSLTGVHAGARSFFGAPAAFTGLSAPRSGLLIFGLTAVVGFGGATLVALNVYRSLTDPIPLFTQDELTVIRAEAYARLDQLPEARTEVNTVRRRAGLLDLTLAQLPTRDAILTEIFRQRTYSLFISGLHWADQRRFGRIDEAKVAYLPYPFAERATNPNTPADPPQP